MRSLDDGESKGSSTLSAAAVCVLCALSTLCLSRSRRSHVEDAVDAELFEKPPIFGVYSAPDEKVFQDTRGSLVVAARAAHRALPVLPCPLGVLSPTCWAIARGAAPRTEAFFRNRFL